jgi:hypothetical protein
MIGFMESVLIKGFWAGLGVAWNARFSPIKITYPRPQEPLTEPEPLGPKSVSYPVRGTLKRLPKGHEIWLLPQDESTGYVWPQGFVAVQYDPTTKNWEGRINSRGPANVKIIAVVAPPTSQQYFRYFQKLGGLRDWTFEPLPNVPPDCVNFDVVQARIPKPMR